MYNIELIKTNLKKNLSEYRYIHSLNVAQTSKELAKIYGINEELAYLTGLVHDIAKELTDEENEYYINKYNLPRFEPEYQRIVHSFVGAVYLKEQYNMDDEICRAVMSHTIANDNMTTLDKILLNALFQASVCIYASILASPLCTFRISILLSILFSFYF